MATPTVYTIGHSNHPAEAFLSLLRSHGIRRLVDVRSVPYSRRMPHFRQRPLARTLRAEAIGYVFLGESLGGRPPGETFYTAAGALDCRRRARAADFLAGIEHLLDLAAECPTAIMCAEEDPARCHRRALIGPVLFERGARIVHIRGNGRTQAEAADGRTPFVSGGLGSPGAIRAPGQLDLPL